MLVPNCLERHIYVRRMILGQPNPSSIKTYAVWISIKNENIKKKQKKHIWKGLQRARPSTDTWPPVYCTLDRPDASFLKIKLFNLNLDRFSSNFISFSRLIDR